MQQLLLKFFLAFILLSSTVFALADDGLLVIGNSLTKHGPAKDLGWDGNWGMAASEEGKDYVHLLADKIMKQKKSNLTIKIIPAGGLEGNFFTTPIKDLLAVVNDHYKYIVLEIGDNIHPNETQKPQFFVNYAETVRILKSKLKAEGKLICLGKWWTSQAFDDQMKDTCNKSGGEFVSLMDITSNNAAYARSERSYSHAGVAAHPGDWGMNKIADKVSCAVLQDAKCKQP